MICVGTQFISTKLRGANLVGANLTDAVFKKIQDDDLLEGLELRKAILTNTRFIGHDLSDVEFDDGLPEMIRVGDALMQPLQDEHKEDVAIVNGKAYVGAVPDNVQFSGASVDCVGDFKIGNVYNGKPNSIKMGDISLDKIKIKCSGGVQIGNTYNSK